jgi:hypothetical protein
MTTAQSWLNTGYIHPVEIWQLMKIAGVLQSGYSQLRDTQQFERTSS